MVFVPYILSSWPEGSVLVTPTLTRLPATVGGLESQSGVTDDAVRFSTLVRIWGVTGQPAISLPIHQTTDGVPVGVQLVGPVHAAFVERKPCPRAVRDAGLSVQPVHGAADGKLG